MRLVVIAMLLSSVVSAYADPATSSSQSAQITDLSQGQGRAAGDQRVRIILDGNVQVLPAREKVASVIDYVRILAWPLVVLIIIVVFQKQLQDLIVRLRRIRGPGGTAAEFDEEVNSAIRKGEAERTRVASAEEQVVVEGGGGPTGVDRGQVDQLNLRVLAQEDPNLALAGLRIRIEDGLKKIARAREIETTLTSASRLASLLHERGVLTPLQLELLRSMIGVCNKAIHGESVRLEQAIGLIDAAGPFFRWYSKQTGSIPENGE